MADLERGQLLYAGYRRKKVTQSVRFACQGRSSTEPFGLKNGIANTVIEERHNEDFEGCSQFDEDLRDEEHNQQLRGRPHGVQSRD
jgi:hypothetical protein